MLDIPEFQELKNLKCIMQVFDNYSRLADLFERYGDEDIQVLIGNETGFDNFSKYAVVFTKVNLPGTKHGFIGLIGPNRMNYSKVIPVVKTIANNIETVLKGW
jgi:heat-inducible transcriptional repressor